MTPTSPAPHSPTVSFGFATGAVYVHLCEQGRQHGAVPMLAAAALIAAVRHPEWAMAIVRDLGPTPTLSEAADMLVRECPIALQEEKEE